MNKKKIGELDGTPIVTGEKNYANEHEYYMTLNGDNTYQKLEQRTNGDLFKTILGEGSGNNTNPGYNVTKSYVALDEETVTISNNYGTYSTGELSNVVEFILGDTYIITFNGTKYECVAYDENGIVYLGATWDNDLNQPDWSAYPFALSNNTGDFGLYTALMVQTDGEYSIKIEHEEKTMTTTPEFKDAVDSVTGYSIDTSSETLFDGTVETEGSNGEFYGIITPTITFVLGDTYKVTFNGTEYTCKCFDNDGTLVIGEPYDYEGGGYDWSTYPFGIVTYPSGGGQYETALATIQEGSYTLKIEHLSVSTKTTSEFESMIQGIAGAGSSSGCQIIYPDYIRWLDGLYSQYNNAPEAGNIYFIPFMDDGSTDGEYLYPVHIDELTNNNNQFSGSATIIGNPIIVDNGTLTIQPFNHMINSGESDGLCINYDTYDNNYKLAYGRIFG